MTFYAVTEPYFVINRGAISRPLGMYLGQKFSELELAKGEEVTVFPNKEAAKSFAQTVENPERTAGILEIKILDVALQKEVAEKMTERGIKVNLDPSKILLVNGECPRLEPMCEYGLSQPHENLLEKLHSSKPISQRVADYFKYYYKESGIIYKLFGIDHKENARDIEAKMNENPGWSDEEVAVFLKTELDKLLRESPDNAKKAFYKTLAYALGEILENNSQELRSEMGFSRR